MRIFQGAFGGALIGLAVNLWVAIGSRMYGAPTVSLPPGPVHNCDNSSLALGLNYSLAGLSTWDPVLALNSTTTDAGYSMGLAPSLGYDVTTSSPEMNPERSNHYLVYSL